MGNSVLICLNDSTWEAIKDDERDYQYISKQTSMTRSIMSDASDNLIERGIKICEIEKKSEKLVNETNEFVSLAKQLKERQIQKQQRSWFRFKL